eukprot:TRINITY_DN3666_c0_g1_i2.p1 TRINITY_DN3666_c0_g1~~TRINITY_DN3666_c0_g1_i2.p1  ORF type:complete len:218 (-),score=41.56 TRINITY_DN3666_c0_g1_i2:388-1041(-)
MAQSQQYVAPTKKITLPAHLAQFQKSKTYSDYIAFILELNDSVKNKKIRDECKISATVEKVLKVFQTLEQYVAETPPLQQTMRYGNKAFRTWFTRVQENAESLMREILPEDKQNAAIELAPYFWDSMGNSTRIDYGTGHETTFVAWMWCLRLLGAVNHEDNTALVLRVFTKSDVYLSSLECSNSSTTLVPQIHRFDATGATDLYVRARRFSRSLELR